MFNPIKINGGRADGTIWGKGKANIWVKLLL
jgi:hypothetical protein